MKDPKFIAELAQSSLNAMDPRIDFRILQDAIRAEDDWLYLPVVSFMHTGSPAPRDFAVSILAKIEADIFTRHQVNILFIPSSAA